MVSRKVPGKKYYKFYCDAPQCPEHINNTKASRLKAAQTWGWAFTESGRGYCSAHIPEWIRTLMEKGVK